MLRIFVPPNTPHTLCRLILVKYIFFFSCAAITIFSMLDFKTTRSLAPNLTVELFLGTDKLPRAPGAWASYVHAYVVPYPTPGTVKFELLKYKLWPVVLLARYRQCQLPPKLHKSYWYLRQSRTTQNAFYTYPSRTARCRRNSSYVRPII